MLRRGLPSNATHTPSTYVTPPRLLLLLPTPCWFTGWQHPLPRSSSNCITPTVTHGRLRFRSTRHRTSASRRLGSESQAAAPSQTWEGCAARCSLLQRSLAKRPHSSSPSCLCQFHNLKASMAAQSRPVSHNVHVRIMKPRVHAYTARTKACSLIYVRMKLEARAQAGHECPPLPPTRAQEGPGGNQLPRAPTSFPWGAQLMYALHAYAHT